MPNTDFQNGVIIATVAGGTEIGITPTGNIDITENGNYDVTDKATAVVNIASGGYGGVAVIPIQSIAEALPTSTLCGLAQNTAPTPYEQGGVWYNTVWLDTSVSPNVWKKYNIDTQTWETV